MPHSLPTSRRFQVFATLWALVVLFHFSKPNVHVTGVSSGALFLAATLLFLFPGSARLLVALAALQVIDFWHRLPAIQTSWYFATLVALALLVAWGRLTWQSRRLDVGPDDLLAEAAPVIRLELVVLMLVSVFHKLNAGFFDPESNPARNLFGQLERYFDVPDAFLDALPVLTVVVEAAIGVFLLLPRLRYLGLLLLVSTWFVLGCLFIVQFSSPLYATGFLFLADDLGDRCSERWRIVRWAESRFGRRLLRGLFLLVLGAATLAPSGNTVLPVVALWFFAGVAVGIGFLLVGLRLRPSAWSGSLRPLPRTTLLFLALLLANEAGPYLGFKAWPVFSMYSGLGTGAESNHYLVPRSAAFLERGGETVEITRASLGGLLGLHPSVEYENGDETRMLPRADLVELARARARIDGLQAGELVLAEPGTDELTALTADEVEALLAEGSALLPCRFFFLSHAPDLFEWVLEGVADDPNTLLEAFARRPAPDRGE